MQSHNSPDLVPPSKLPSTPWSYLATPSLCRILFVILLLNFQSRCASIVASWSYDTLSVRYPLIAVIILFRWKHKTEATYRYSMYLQPLPVYPKPWRWRHPLLPTLCCCSLPLYQPFFPMLVWLSQYTSRPPEGQYHGRWPSTTLSRLTDDRCVEAKSLWRDKRPVVCPDRPHGVDVATCAMWEKEDRSYKRCVFRCLVFVLSIAFQKIIICSCNRADYWCCWWLLYEHDPADLSWVMLVVPRAFQSTNYEPWKGSVSKRSS